jgi:hypothetical protein
VCFTTEIYPLSLHFLWMNYITLSLSVHPFMNTAVSISWLLWIILHKHEMQKFLWDADFISFGYKPRGTQSYVSSTLFFLMNLYIIFHSSHYNVHSPISVLRTFLSPHPHQHLLSHLLMIVTLASVRWYFPVDLFFIFLTISPVEHLLMYLFTICMCSLEK